MIPKINYSEYNLDIMARTLFGEAAARNTADATAIAWVIRNRYEYGKPRWNLSITGVCQAPMQFSCWNENDPNRARITNATYDANPWLVTCQKIAKSVLDGKVNDPTVRSTHYHTPAVAPAWSRGKRPIYTTKGHVFYNDIDTPKPDTALHYRIAVKPVAVASVGTAAGVGAVASIPTETLIEAVQHVTPAVSTLSMLDWRVACAVLGVAVLIGFVWFLAKKK